MTGKNLTLDVRQFSTTVAEVKTMISEKDGERDDQRLTFVGPLDDDQTLAYYNVQNQSSITDVGRLRAGMQSEPQDNIESIEIESN